MYIKRNWLALVATLLLVMAACGGSDDDAGNGTPADTQSTSAPSDDGAAETTSAPAAGETPAVTEMGSFTVNDQEFAVTFLNRCIPFEGEGSEQIDLQPIAQGQGAGLNLYGTADQVEVSVQGTAVEEIGGSIAFAADSFDDGAIQESTISGDRWSGSAVLSDSFGTGDTVDVTWDVQIPSEIRDCSL